MITIGISTAAVRAVFIVVSASATGELSCYHSYINADTTNYTDYRPYEMAGLEQRYSCCDTYDRRQQECAES
jgi:predicted homoserine dehydrogenase-like protein